MEIKYKLDYLFVGFIMYWVIDLISFFSGEDVNNKILHIILPFTIWGVMSLLDYTSVKTK